MFISEEETLWNIKPENVILCYEKSRKKNELEKTLNAALKYSTGRFLGIRMGYSKRESKDGVNRILKSSRISLDRLDMLYAAVKKLPYSMVEMVYSAESIVRRNAVNDPVLDRTDVASYVYRSIQPNI